MSLRSDLSNEASMLLSLAFNWFRRRWVWFTIIQAALLLVIWVGLHPYDHALLAVVRAQPLGLDPGQTRSVAGWLSKWGDFPGLNLGLGVLLWTLSHFCQRPKWRRWAIMTLLCAVLAGLATDVLRAGLGRSRPYSKKDDAFYGPSLSHQFQSSPSGHTTTAFAAGIPLLIVAPPLGVATTVVAAGVGWSRMYLNQHYPADVAFGIWMALWFAVPLGFAARVRRISDEP